MLKKPNAHVIREGGILFHRYVYFRIPASTSIFTGLKHSSPLIYESSGLLDLKSLRSSVWRGCGADPVVFRCSEFMLDEFTGPGTRMLVDVVGDW